MGVNEVSLNEMTDRSVHLTGRERTFPSTELVVTKTDLKGRITYANDVFIELSGYSESELIGQPHKMVRHPHMPRSIFKLLWTTIQSKNELFSYIVNRSKNGDHYWVKAHVTPWFASDGTIQGFHSNRRVPERQVLRDVIEPLYEELLKEERRHKNAKEGLAASSKLLEEKVSAAGFSSYEIFIHSLSS